MREGSSDGRIYRWKCDCCGNQIQVSLKNCRDCSAWNPVVRKKARLESLNRQDPARCVILRMKK